MEETTDPRSPGPLPERAAQESSPFSLSRALSPIAEVLEKATKDAARAMADDNRVYMFGNEMEILSLHSRLLFNLVQAREVISEILKRSPLPT